VLGETGVLNNALRFEDEFVRHKILDVIGDLSLVGHPVVGHLVAHRGGHALHTAFAAKILEETDAWQIVESPDMGMVPDLTRVEITVLDKRTRKPITGLTAEDFVVTVSGDLQRVTCRQCSRS
jgi:hypothetical protein